MRYDVIVIGGGHAGVEAALSCARLQKKTLLITGNKNYIASMPCNPSIGGPAKGILVREIDALGGRMAKTADATALQFKMLNLSKGRCPHRHCGRGRRAFRRTHRRQARIPRLRAGRADPCSGKRESHSYR